MEGFIVSLVIFTAIFTIFGLGLNLQWGFTGLINFGHVAFMTVGAYGTVLLSMAGVPLGLAMLAGAIAASLLGLGIGLATLRLREDYLAIVTIGLAEVIRLVAVNEEWLTRGTFGLQSFPLPLAMLNPNPIVRVAMVGTLAAVVGLAYWRLWGWMRHTARAIPRSDLVTHSLTALGYLLALGLLLLGIGAGARTLRQAAIWPNGVLGMVLLSALLGALWLGKGLSDRLSRRFRAWSTSLGLVMAALLAVLGVYAFGYAASAVYRYSNPSKSGLLWLSVLLTALIFWGLETLVRSPWGRVLKAIREDEAVAKALGKNVFIYKLQALMMGGFLAGIAGSLYAWQLTTVYPDNFRSLVTFNAWTIVVLGGAGSNVGTLLGATVFWAYDTITRFVLRDIVPLDDARLGAFRIMVIGLILIVLMMWRPQGILGNKDELTLGR
ncbi:MAG: branched-chain amino acid ABC transporter permease [Kaiparowitsia implicata GSE-PSE-MK54-09C]|jgi:neutral amino acid transport system permease protein|nr:branched-chain amino acid ABC transporter permease [Kaiparowitsia implicata GSE-PSE-MK54-09C]